jgi:phospholipid-transporting ATPase
MLPYPPEKSQDKVTVHIKRDSLLEDHSIHPESVRSDSSKNIMRKNDSIETAKALQVRRITLGERHRSKEFASNRVKTSRYTVLTWAPLSLLYQFRRAANIYFLIISILTAMPFSPKNPYSMGATFVAVLVFTMFKELFEDIYRHKADNEVNDALVDVLNRETGRIEKMKSMNLVVGEIVRVNKNQTIPADLVFLVSSDPKGVAFVNTKNLDGETNLKDKQAFEMTKHLSEKLLAELTGEVQCDKPNPSLVKWNCNIKIRNSEWEALTMNQLLLRGCIIKNTDYIYGLVIYTGRETKIMLNSKPPTHKTSNVLKRMNTLLYSVFVFQCVICLLYAGLFIDWRKQKGEDHTYLDLDEDPNAGDYFIQILVFLVAYSHLVPISLYVSMEVVKLGQAYLINNDVEIYYTEDDKRANCRTSDLIEELGQVSFVFSDKTGTLTCNEMVFKKCSINGHLYELYKERATQIGYQEDSLEIVNALSEHTLDNDLVSKFFYFLAICHSVFPSYDADEDKIRYQAASPDELALVEASKTLGIEFFEREDKIIRLRDKRGKVDEWIKLVEIPFNSDRKRMSVIVKNGNKYEILTKGADSVMMELVGNYGKTSKEELNNQLLAYAREGLRTLVMGSRIIDKEEYERWYDVWHSLELSSDPDKQIKMFDHAKSIEMNLNLVGASAIEDKLQDGVPKTIEMLIKAGIRVWVLTGDKSETAIEIGKSCNLIQGSMELIEISADSQEDLRAKLEKYSNDYTLSRSIEQIQNDIIYDSPTAINHERKVALVIDGKTLSYVLEDPSGKFQETFFKLGLMAKSCICCRVSPSQKAEVVKLAHHFGKWITLSIGDGANDVNMIQTARIGVGISGKEGTEAVQASDFSIAQFRFLQKLVLVHGRWGYRRICWFICYFFYKNITVVFTELWFQIFSGFSGQIYYMDWLPMLYNSLWTSWPCIITFVFDKDLGAEACLKYPNAYGAGRTDAYFTFGRFWKWVILALIHGTICFWIPNRTFEVAGDSDGNDFGMWWISTVSFTLVIVVVTLKLLLESTSWTLLTGSVYIGSVLFYVVSIIILNTNAVAKVFQPEANQLVFNMLGTGKFWLVMFLTPVFALLPDYLIAAGQSVFWPSPDDEIIRAIHTRENKHNKHPDRMKINCEYDPNYGREETVVNQKQWKSS